MSPSTRKAWIEITLVFGKDAYVTGRLPHGRRGLKFECVNVCIVVLRSPSTRKAWIEISKDTERMELYLTVAFHTEGVD